MLGRPASWAPVWKNVMPGSWLIASVYIDLTKHRSSTTFAVWGNRSLTHAPDCPCCANLKFGGATGKVACVEVMPVNRCPIRIDAGSSEPRRSCSRGL
jgi:hypothetical protein